MNGRLLVLSLGCIAVAIGSGNTLADEDTAPALNGLLFGAAQTLQLRLGFRHGEAQPNHEPPSLAPLDNLWEEAQSTSGLSAEFAWLPARRFKFALDVQWSNLDSTASTRTLVTPAMAIGKRDVWDYRLGAAWEFQPGWVVRGGYNRSRPLRQAHRLNPGWADEHGHSLDLGVGMSGKRWSIDAVYEYTWAQAVHATDGSTSFFGDYQNGEHIGGIFATVRY